MPTRRGPCGAAGGRSTIQVGARRRRAAPQRAGRDLMREVLRDASFCVPAVDSPPALSPAWHGDAILTDTFASLLDPAATSSEIAALRERYHVAVILVTAHDRAKRERGTLGAD